MKPVHLEQVVSHDGMTSSGTVHVPVLLEETVAALRLEPGDFVIDGTYGGGGHAKAILERIGAEGRLLAVDWNEHAIAGCNDAHGEDPRVTCAMGNFRDIPEMMRLAAFPHADAVLLDLGISSDELEHSGRGFTFKEDEPLRMTYNDTQEPVADLLRGIGEDDLAAIIRAYGEERYSGRIARVIKERVKAGLMETTSQLADAVTSAVPHMKGKHSRIHPATRTFMALRIFANEELENVKAALAMLPRVLSPGGRAAIISFHSLEDRIVKHGFRDLAQKKIAEIETKKPITAGDDELKTNPRARSAKLRSITINP